MAVKSIALLVLMTEYDKNIVKQDYSQETEKGMVWLCLTGDFGSRIPQES